MAYILISPTLPSLFKLPPLLLQTGQSILPMEFLRHFRGLHMKRMLPHAFRFFNFSLALFLLSRSSSSCFRTLLSHYSFTLFNHPLYVFLLQNLIIFFIFALSHRPTAPSPTHTHLVQTPDSTRSRCSKRPENYSGMIVVGGTSELNGLNSVASRYGSELGRRLCSVDKLSKEDFNRTVEEFIAKQRSMLWQEHGE